MEHEQPHHSRVPLDQFSFAERQHYAERSEGHRQRPPSDQRADPDLAQTPSERQPAEQFGVADAIKKTEADPNRSIRDYVDADGPRDWRYKDAARDFYEMADVFTHYFFAPKRTEQPTIPHLVLGVAMEDPRTLAFYRLVPNTFGLSYEITMNARYLHRPRWEQYETLLHEMVHLYQEFMATSGLIGFESCKNGYHNKQFVSICEELGLHPRLGTGSHYRPADGQFARLMDRYWVAPPPRPVEVPKARAKENWFDAERGSKRGSSTLLKWVCDGCQPPKSVRSGRRDLHALCLDCHTRFKVQ